MKDLGALALAVAKSAQSSNCILLSFDFLSKFNVIFIFLGEVHPEQDVLISILIELQIRFKGKDIIKNFLATNEYISMVISFFF